MILRGSTLRPDGGLLRLFGCFDVGAGLAPSARRFALSASQALSSVLPFGINAHYPALYGIGLMAD